MATTNRFQTRVIIPDKTSLTDNEIRLNSLLEQAQTCFHRLDELQENEHKQNALRESELEKWSSRMFEKVDDLYKSCLKDLKQSYDQLQLFQQLMIQILNNGNENNLDGKKLLVLEHEICLLRCLTYQLDTTKVKIEGKLKLKSVDNEREVSIDDDINQNDQHKTNEENYKKDFVCRLLVNKDSINKIQELPLFKEFVKMAEEINESTPERVLTITGKEYEKYHDRDFLDIFYLGSRQLEVIENILLTLYPSPVNQCELRILLHQGYAPSIFGRLGDRAKLLREKYSLHTLNIHPTCAPRSTERVLLIQSLSPDKIISCLQEIFTNINQHSCDADEAMFYNEMYVEFIS